MYTYQKTNIIWCCQNKLHFGQIFSFLPHFILLSAHRSIKVILLVFQALLFSKGLRGNQNLASCLENDQDRTYFILTQVQHFKSILSCVQEIQPIYRQMKKQEILITYPDLQEGFRISSCPQKVKRMLSDKFQHKSRDMC